MNLRLEWVDPKTLAPNPKNWRRHPQAQREALEGVLGDVGWAGAALFNEATGKLIDGHLRLDVAMRRGDEAMPVLIGSWDEAQEAEILATLDPIAALAEADTAQLDALLRDVQTGSAAVMDMLAALAEEAGLYQEKPIGGGGDEYDATSEDGPARTHLGDLWQLGEHRLLVGDCTVAENVARLMDGARAEMMVTDPPYGVEYVPTWRHSVGLNQSDRVGAVANDGRADWREAWALFEGDVVYCWHADRRASEVQLSLEASGFEMRCQIIWAKQQLVIGRGHYHFQHEPCWYAVRRGATAAWAGDRKQTTLWQIDNPLKSGEEATIHGTQKPIECMARAIRNHDAALIYDPFLGSGTTLIACERLKRKCYGCEIEPKYADVILRRWETETGQEAVLVERVIATGATV